MLSAGSHDSLRNVEMLMWIENEDMTTDDGFTFISHSIFLRYSSRLQPLVAQKQIEKTWDRINLPLSDVFRFSFPKAAKILSLKSGFLSYYLSSHPFTNSVWLAAHLSILNINLNLSCKQKIPARQINQNQSLRSINYVQDPSVSTSRVYNSCWIACTWWSGAWRRWLSVASPTVLSSFLSQHRRYKMCV